MLEVLYSRVSFTGALFYDGHCCRQSTDKPVNIALPDL
ncbi:hypothetical protein SAMN04488128_102532 [Chitinophaga eiseniae]|uniref:Uncharacterized protein n=1 Tax=Chitinophaga eiseniae TaxID=634771 RepID=A0A1T4QQN9_9BACT|nr:hypothetical protein SAMN04488128_102532 [Chitinophaga eiseniae]